MMAKAEVNRAPPPSPWMARNTISCTMPPPMQRQLAELAGQAAEERAEQEQADADDQHRLAAHQRSFSLP